MGPMKTACRLTSEPSTRGSHGRAQASAASHERNVVPSRWLLCRILDSGEEQRAVNDTGVEAAALARVRVLPEIEPFFHGLGFAIIGPQCLIAHWPGNCGLVVAGSAAAGAGHDLRRLGIGREDADCSASTTGGAFGRHEVYWGA